MIVDSTIDVDIAAINERLEQMDVEERIHWAINTLQQSVVLLSSMQKSASVLMHYFYKLKLGNQILFVDTGYHFRETLQLRDEFMRRYKLNIITLYPECTPEQQEKVFNRKLYLFVDGKKECCRLRKTVPYVNYMKQNSLKLALVGLRRCEGGQRAKLKPLIKDPRTGGFTLYPLLDWTDEQITQYLQDNDVPVHVLHACNYPSIGCECCTTPVKPGEDPRAGRWRHLREKGDVKPMYCNINFSDGSGI